MTFLAPVLAVLHLFSHNPTTQYERMINRVQASVVRITLVKNDEPHTCTGFVLAPNRVLTALHCYGESLLADGQPAAVLKSDALYDLMLLDVPTNKPILHFTDKPLTRFQPLTGVGYAFGWTRLADLRERVVLIDYSLDSDSPPGVLVQQGFIGGMSGGPLVDDKGRVVAVIQQSDDGMGYGVGTLLIRAFLLRTDVQ